MILKSLSCKSSSSSLIRYIFKEQAAYWESKTSSKSNWYVPGIKLTKQDIQHLESEKEDVGLLQELKEVFKGNIQKFIESKISPKATENLKKENKPFIIKNNIRARSFEGFCREFSQNESRRLYSRSDQVSSYHVILSWSPKDAAKITDAMLKDIAGEYIRLRGNNCMVVGTKHTEKDHIHLHLAVSGTLLNGKSSRQTKAEFKVLKDKLQEYQQTKYPVLSNSLPKHGRGANKEIPLEKNIKTERLSEKQALLRCLDEVYLKATSKEDFISQMESLGHVPYYRNGRFQGIKYNGETKHRIYRYGYDDAKLQALDLQKAKVEKELKDIQNIRNSKSIDKNRLVYQEVDDLKLQGMNRELQQAFVNARKEFERKTGVALGSDTTGKEENALEEIRSLRSVPEKDKGNRTNQDLDGHALQELKEIRDDGIDNRDSTDDNALGSKNDSTEHEADNMDEEEETKTIFETYDTDDADDSE